MALLHIPLGQIDEARLQTLIASGAPESRTIEYKRETYGASDGDLAEFLADISSFANTSGGDLVLGIDAAKGIPTAPTPLSLQIDQEKLRLEQVARGGLQPRVVDIAFHAVPVQAGGNVLIIRVPRSYSAPHRVIRGGRFRFWARSGAGKYEPDVNELRTLFNAGPQLADRIRNFRLDRIAKIAAAQAPVQLFNEGILVLHIIPLSAFDGVAGLNLDRIQRNFRSFVPMGSETANNARINFDGVLKTSNAAPQATKHRAYLQLYRSGIIETVSSTLISSSSGKQIIFNVDNLLIQETKLRMKDLADVGIGPPYAVLVTFIGVAGARFDFDRDASARFPPHDLSDILDRDQYHFDEVIFETVPIAHAEFAGIIRPILDQLANVGGKAASSLFDSDGNYIQAVR